jgi:hypothetical protein
MPSPELQMRNSVLILSAAALSLAASSVQAQITNGGFEAPGTPNGSYLQYGGGGSFTGWNVTGADILLLNTTYVETGIVFTAHSGSSSLDITGAGNTSPLDGVNQDIATVLGQTYQLSFYVGRGDDQASTSNYLTPSTVDLSIDGGSLVSFTNSDLTVGGVNWKLFTTNFVAAGSLTNLAFFNGTAVAGLGGNNFAGLDDVSVQAVPEPATMAALGLGALGLLRRRARRN